MQALIAYYSFTKNTEKTSIALSEFLKEKGYTVDILEVKPKKEARRFLHQAMQAVTKTGGELSEGIQCDFKNYDAVFVGSPVWAFSPSPCIRKYILKAHHVEAKPVYLFVTYGSGLGRFKALDIMEAILKRKQADVLAKIAVLGKKTNDTAYLREVFSMEIKI